MKCFFYTSLFQTVDGVMSSGFVASQKHRRQNPETMEYMCNQTFKRKPLDKKQKTKNLQITTPLDKPAPCLPVQDECVWLKACVFGLRHVCTQDPQDVQAVKRGGDQWGRNSNKLPPSCLACRASYRPWPSSFRCVTRRRKNGSYSS